jgi:hypothetical protein
MRNSLAGGFALVVLGRAVFTAALAWRARALGTAPRQSAHGEVGGEVKTRQKVRR